VVALLPAGAGLAAAMIAAPAWVGVATFVLAAAGGWVLARALASRLQAFVAQARRIRAGDYAHPAPAGGPAELAGLATALADMQRTLAEREERLRHEALHDPLTGLLNRSGGEAALAAQLADAVRRDVPLGLLRIDLERFSEVNDALGSGIGDRALVEVGRRVAAAGAAAARLGSDDFVVALPGSGPGVAVERARRLAREIARDIPLDRLRVRVQAEVGVVVAPVHGEEAAVLLRRADLALRRAKADRVGVALYSEGEDERHLRRIALVQALPRAVEEGQLHLLYQPKVDVRTREVERVEALLRWRHPTLGEVAPDEFVPIAEHTGRIREITRWVLDAVLRQARAWNDRGIHLGIAVNVSALDLGALDLPATLERLLARRGVPAAALTLELTETALMRDPERSLAVLQQVKACGVRLALDDFGTGHSSLAQLKRIPADELKIDKAFVTRLKDGSEDAILVRAVIDLGHRLGLRVVAEGLEDLEGWRLLSRWGCDVVQGYLVSRPLEPAVLTAWLEGFYRTGARQEEIDPALVADPAAGGRARG